MLNAQATLTAAHADVASAQSPLLGIDVGNEEGVLNITAPVSGTIYRVNEENERVVQAGNGMMVKGD